MNNKKSEQVLPCKNLIACGYCNIKNCKYIHDYRIKSNYKNLKNNEYKQYDLDKCTTKGNKSGYFKGINKNGAMMLEVDHKIEEIISGSELRLENN